MTSKAKPIVAYYYRDGNLKKLDSYCREFATLEDGIAAVNSRRAKNFYKTWQIVFIDYTTHPSYITHILEPIIP